ncbi:hypothetical protein IID19_04665 [Patescibacteria group bacterium]|nr:hypothetical protein [Patescibacteria group bacterium]
MFPPGIYLLHTQNRNRTYSPQTKGGPMTLSLADNSFVSQLNLCYLRTQALNARESTEQQPVDEAQITLRLSCAELESVFRTSAHREFTLMFASATDEDLQALAESGVYLGEMYPRSNGTRPQKLLPLLKKLRIVHQDTISELNLSAAA